VVVEVDIVPNGQTEGTVVVEATAVVHVRLHRLVPGFHVRVIVHASWPVGGLEEAGSMQPLLEVASDELDSAIAVEQRARRRSAGTQRIR